MTHRPRRALPLLVVIVLGLALGGAGYVAIQVASAPGQRDAPGWELLASMPEPRGETASAVVGRRVYVAGGYVGLDFATTDLVSVYDAAAGSWSAGPPLPAPRNHAAAAALDGTVYVAGGAAASGEATGSLWALAAGATAWTELRAMPETRSAHGLVALDGRLYVVGGVGSGATLVYDPTTATWSAAAPLPENRDHLGAVEVDGEIWAIGGRAGGANLARVDIYDPSADAWRSGPPLPIATSGAAEALVGGVICLSGGEDPARAAIVDRHWRLDTTLGAAASWTELAPPPFAVHGVPGVALDGRFLVIGGSTRPGGQSNTAWTGAAQAFVGP